VGTRSAQGDADAGRDRMVVPSEGAGKPQHLHDAFCDAGRLVRPSYVLEEDDELVAAEARDGIFGPQFGPQALGDPFEYFVPRFVAQGIVDLLQVVQIGEQ
jgi:hypothetical protein